MSTTWVEGEKVRVVVTNHTKYTIRDCSLVNDKSDVVTIGTLTPGQTSAPAIVNWTYKDSSQNIHLPPAPANWQFAPSTQIHHADTEEDVRNSLKFAVSEAFKGTNGYSGNPYTMQGMGGGEDDVQVFGRSTNVLTGWLDTNTSPILNVHLDGKPAAGAEASLLCIHLPTARNLPPEMASGINPFDQPPVLNLKDEQTSVGRGLIPR